MAQLLICHVRNNIKNYVDFRNRFSFLRNSFEKFLTNLKNITPTTNHNNLLIAPLLSQISTAEIGKVLSDFYNIPGFPRVVGSIEDAHIEISSPRGETAELNIP